MEITNQPIHYLHRGSKNSLATGSGGSGFHWKRVYRFRNSTGVASLCSHRACAQKAYLWKAWIIGAGCTTKMAFGGKKWSL